MSAHDERLTNLRDHLTDAKDGIAGLPKAHRDEHSAQVERLEHVIAFAAVALERTDPEMVTDQAVNEIQAAALQIANDPTTAATNAVTYGDPLILAILRLPVTAGRDVEQSVKDAAASFQRSTAQRLTSLRGSFAEAKEEVASLREEMDRRSNELAGEIETARLSLQEKLDELQQAIEVQRQALDELSTRHSTAFSEAQEERATTFQGELSTFREELDGLMGSVAKEVEERVDEIRRMEKESSQLVGAIGLAGTAERYSEEVTEQAKIANRWRLATIGLGLAAVAVGIYAIVVGDQTNQDLTAKLVVSIILGGLAAYSARQSARHRRREEQARQLQLELTAFGPFIEPLAPEQREEERVVMARKTFGKSTDSAAPEEEPGPTALSFLMRRRQKELESG